MNKFTKVSIGITAAVNTFLANTAQIFAADEALPRINIPGDFFFEDPSELLSRLLRSIMIIAGVLVFAYLIWGGIEWITSGGDSSKTEAARDKIMAAVVGLIILASTYAIFQLMLTLLGVEGYAELFRNVN